MDRINKSHFWRRLLVLALLSVANGLLIPMIPGR